MSSQRQRKRASVRVFALGKEPGDDLSGSTTAAERVDMMWPLALEAWALAGRPVPSYRRAETPVRVVRREDTDDGGAPR